MKVTFVKKTEDYSDRDNTLITLDMANHDEAIKRAVEQALADKKPMHLKIDEYNFLSLDHAISVCVKGLENVTKENIEINFVLDKANNEYFNRDFEDSVESALKTLPQNSSSEPSATPFCSSFALKCLATIFATAAAVTLITALLALTPLVTIAASTAYMLGTAGIMTGVASYFLFRAANVQEEPVSSFCCTPS